MSWQIIDISKDGYYLSVHLESLIVSYKKQEMTRQHLKNINSILVHAHNVTYSHHLFQRCAEIGVMIVICDMKHMPVSAFFPIAKSYDAKRRLFMQLNIAKPLSKQIWQKIVQAKIKAQAYILKSHQINQYMNVEMLISQVKSDDTTNKEAEAARKYWKPLLGRNFTRDTHSTQGLNIFLNYGYMILRSAMARAIVGAGLHPGFSHKHDSISNFFCLVDDLIEPFRPLVDDMVKKKQAEFEDRVLTPADKSYLSRIMIDPIPTDKGRLHLPNLLNKYVHSYIRCIETKSVEHLWIPCSKVDLLNKNKEDVRQLDLWTPSSKVNVKNKNRDVRQLELWSSSSKETVPDKDQEVRQSDRSAAKVEA